MENIISCTKCGEMFEKWHPKGRVCRDCTARRQSEYMRKYREKHPGFEMARHKRRIETQPGYLEAHKRRGRDYWRRIRQEAIMAYGGYVCACCGETEPLFLTIDHIDNDGADHRREIGGGANFGKWLKDHGYPPGFQVLCFNCNIGKAHNGGECPHKGRRSDEAPTLADLRRISGPVVRKMSAESRAAISAALRGKPNPGTAERNRLRAKLSPNKVIEIRALLEAGAKTAHIQRWFDISSGTISLIRQGKR